jgi:predicted amidohydrolase
MTRQSVRVGIHQAEPGSGLSPTERAHYRDAGVEILVFPEYFWVRPGDEDHHQAASHTVEDLNLLETLSGEEGWVVVGGTVVETVSDRHHNACPVFVDGIERGRYRKINLMPGEAKSGITPGHDFVLVEALGIRLAPVICADVLYPVTFDSVASLGADLILAPMSSPLISADTPEEKDARDRELFLKGAAKAGAPIVKAGANGNLFGRPLQGRSLVSTPREILFRTPFDEELERRTWVVDVPIGLPGEPIA